MTHFVNIQSVNKNHLTQSMRAQLSSLVSSSSVSDSRLLDLLASRTALQQALRHHGEALKIEELIIENNHSLMHYKSILVSLAHTKNTGAAIVTSDPRILGIGIDIEFSHRKMPENAEKYYIHSQDENYPRIQLWCLKEAIFKAINPLRKNMQLKDLQMRDFYIQDSKIYSHAYIGIIGDVSVEIKIEENQELIVASAFIHTLKNKID